VAAHLTCEPKLDQFRGYARRVGATLRRDHCIGTGRARPCWRFRSVHSGVSVVSLARGGGFGDAVSWRAHLRLVTNLKAIPAPQFPRLQFDVQTKHIMTMTPERRLFLSPIPRLRIGSTLLTRGGVQFRVREAVVMVAQSGGESPSLLVERIREGRTEELFIAVGMLANRTRGATHHPGSGVLIDWAHAPRRPLIEAHGPGAPRPTGVPRRPPPPARG
jgi:hypothetical protein